MQKHFSNRQNAHAFPAPTNHETDRTAKNAKSAKSSRSLRLRSSKQFLLKARCLLIGFGMLVFAAAVSWGGPQKSPAAKAESGLADAQHYNIDIELQPDSHRIKAQVTIDFVAIDSINSLTLDLNRNCTVNQVFDGQGQELEHSQDDFETFTVRARLREEVKAGDKFSLRFLYEGVFDKAARRTKGPMGEVETVVAEEGSYLPYAARWIPTYRFLVDRATSKMTVKVPLGYTAIGPGQQLASQVEGLTESFSSICSQPYLPASLIVAQLFPKNIDQEGFKADYFVEEGDLPACEKVHAILQPYVRYYQEKYGSLAWGDKLSIVEVPPANDYFPGAPGILYVPRSIFQAPKPDASSLARRLAYQWWGHLLPLNVADDVWLLDASSFYALLTYVENTKGSDALREELGNLEILALQSEGKSALQNAFRLGYQGEDYLSLSGGKGGWVLYMLRNLIGDDKFGRLLSLWRASALQPAAATEDFRALASKVAGEDLKWFFIQWVESIGVPQFEVEYIMLKTRTGFRVAGSVKQDRDLFRMPVEIGVETKDKTERSVITVQGKRSDFRLDVDAQPVRVLVDPDSHVLRDSPELKIQVLIARGRQLYERDQLIESIQEYEEALRLNSHKSQASFYLGETLYAQWNIQSAANAFRDALNGDLDPKWIEVWSYIYLGKIFDVLGQRDRAVAEYTKAVNTKNDYNGAQEEAQKYIKQPFTRERSVIKK